MGGSPYRIIRQSGYDIAILEGESGLDPADDNVDIEVRFADGRWYAGTIFTLENVRSLLVKYRRTGECGGGLYHWAANMIIVERLTPTGIAATVRALLEEGEFYQALSIIREPDVESK